MPTRPSSEVVGPRPLSPAFSVFTMDTLSWDVPLSPGDSPRATSPLDDYALEAQFCRDFFCCNIKLPNLHDLIQHYEERHVKFEDEHGLLDDWSSQGSRVGSPVLAASKLSQESVSLSDIYSIEVASMSQLSEDAVSAFENAIIRTTTQNARKRKLSLSAQEGTATKKSLNASSSSLFSSFAGVAGLSPEELDEHLQRAIAYSLDAGYHASHTYSSEVENTSPWLIRSNSMEPMAVQPSQTNAAAAAAAQAVVSEVGGPTIVVAMPPVAPPAQPAPRPTAAAPATPTGTVEKPYRCEVPGCEKTYKNKNGLKYHILNGHVDPVLKEAASQERKQQRLEERANRFAYYPQQPMFSSVPKAAVPVDNTIIDVVSIQPDQHAPPSPKMVPAPPTPPPVMAVPAPLHTSSPSTPAPTSPVSTPASPASEEVIKPYRCAVSDCGKTYKNLGGLKYHIDKVHDGNPLAMAMGRKKVTSATPPKIISNTTTSISSGLFVRLPEPQKTSLLSANNNNNNNIMVPAPLPKKST